MTRLAARSPSAEAPEIVPFSMDAPLSVGRDAALTCTVYRGDTPLSIVWTVDGGPVSALPGVRVLAAGSRTSLLTIESVGAAHSGEYTCTASNAVGEAAHSAYLAVKGASASLVTGLLTATCFVSPVFPMLLFLTVLQIPPRCIVM